MNTRDLVLAATVAALAGTTASAQSLTPPNISVLGGTWAFTPAYTQPLSGTETINAFRLVADAQTADPTSSWQSDMQLELVSPDNTTILIGGNTTNWNNARYSGTGPTGTGNPESFDGVYLANLGTIDGTWSVNFRNSFGTTGTLFWNNIQITPLQLPSGACCSPGGSCSIQLEGVCITQGGTYQGDGTDCTITCPQPPTGACCLADGTCSIEGSFECTNLGGLYRGDGTDCTTACPLNLTAHYNATTSTAGAGAGAYFNLTALDPTGIVIEGFDINSQAAAGTPITAHVYVKPGVFSGFETDASAWTLLGEVQTFAAGQGNRTPVPIGDLQIAGGETWALRVGASNGGIRYNTAATTDPYFFDSNVEIEIGIVQTALFSGSLFGTFPTSLRGWNGSVYYNVGANVSIGACCLPDGSCEELSELFCTGTGGTYHGDNTTCATTPPGGCPQPPVGACCLPDNMGCTVMWEPGCLSEGGLYQGDGTDCATVTCPLSLTTAYDGTLNATAANAGAYFNVTATNPQGIVVEDFQFNSAAAAGTALDVHIYIKPGSYVGHESDASAWTLLDQVQTVSAGQGKRTAVPLNVPGLHIGENETWGVRIGVASGGIRYTNTASTVEIHSNSDLQIQLGSVQNNLFGAVLSGIRGWNGTVFYSVGANVTTGACCFADGTCTEVREVICIAEGGTYRGDNTECATANCPQPGACCVPSGCLLLSEGECLAFNGDYRGNGTDCATANCPAPTVSNIVGFTFTTLGSTTADPQNWTRISQPTGTLFNVPDDTGVPTAVGIDWSGGVGGNGFLFLGTSTLGANAVPQHTYDLSGMTGYGFRASAEFTIELSGLTPTTEYEYWFVAYRSISAIENFVQVSLGDIPNATSFAQSMTAAQNDGRFVVNETIADSSMFWETLAKTTTSSSNGTITFNWEGAGQTPVIGALAIREILGSTCYANCDNSTIEPILNVDDFTCFINEFAQAQNLPHAQQVTHYANCDGSTIAPVLNVDDFTCFINAFAAGCP